MIDALVCRPGHWGCFRCEKEFPDAERSGETLDGRFTLCIPCLKEPTERVLVLRAGKFWANMTEEQWARSGEQMRRDAANLWERIEAYRPQAKHWDIPRREHRVQVAEYVRMGHRSCSLGKVLPRRKGEHGAKDQVVRRIRGAIVRRH